MSWPVSSAEPRIGVSESRVKKPVWMSRARSVPAFIVEKSAPWMNGTASAKARNDVDGKPGSSRRRLQAAGVDGQQREREDERWDRARRLPDRTGHRAPGQRTDLRRQDAHARARLQRSRSLRLRLRRAFERAPGLGEEDVVQRRRAQLDVLDRDALRVEGAHHVGQPVPVPQAHGDVDAAVERLAEALQRGLRCAGGPRRGTATTWTLGRPISAFSSAGVPSATIRPWSMMPDPVGEDVRLLEVLRREEDRDAVLAREARDLFPERGAALWIEPGGRLVEKEDARPVHEGEREVEPALHPARVAPDLAVGGLREPDALEQRLAPAARARAWVSPGASSAGACGRGP